MAKGTVFKRGKKYYYKFVHNGVQVYKAGTEDEKETRTLMRQAIADAELNGIFSYSDMTVTELLNIWFKECVSESLRHGTRMDYRNAIENHIIPALGSKQLKDITIDDLQQYIDAKQKEYAASTLKSHLVVLNGAFKYAVYPKKYIKDNPMLYVTKKKINRNLDTFLDIEDDSKIKILTQDEYNKILDYCKGTIYYIPVIIGYHTGCRAGEVCGLTWNDIDLNQKTLRINKSMFYNVERKRWELGKTKGGKPRTIDIGDTLIDILKQERRRQKSQSLYYGEHYQKYYYDLIEEDGMRHIVITTEESPESVPLDFVCQKEDNSLFTNQTTKYCAKRIVRDLNIDFNFHMLRHTHATVLIENGANMKDVQERLGHTDIRITMNTYSHVTPKMKKQTVDIFEKALY